MRTLTILMGISFAIPALSRGQSVPTAESPALARIYHLLRRSLRQARSLVRGAQSGLNSYRIGGPRPIDVPLKPRFSAKADISSGDDPRTNTLGTFNPLFPKGDYFGVLATAGPGPINFIDAHPRVETTLPHGVTVSVDWIFQWRESCETGCIPFPDF